MKKLFSLVLFFISFSNIYLVNVAGLDQSNNSDAETVLIDRAALETLQRSFDELQKKLTLPLPARSQSNLEQTKNISITILKTIESIFKFTVDKADKLTSKKTVIAFAVVAAPFIVLYCTYFDSEILKNFLGSLIKNNSKAAADTTIIFAKDAAEGIGESILDNKMAVAEIAFVGGAGYATISLIKGVLSKAVEEIGGIAGPKIADASVWCVNYALISFAYLYNRVKFN